MDEPMPPEDFRTRTRRFALSIIKLYAKLPTHTVPQVLGKQLLRSGTSVGAHYHEGCRARSDAELISKLEGAQQELEETQYWLCLIQESGTLLAVELTGLQAEADELMAILVTATKNIKSRRTRS
jgi:four helix bundle protein